MYTIKIMNEFLHGAVWVYEDGIPSSWDKIDNDSVLSDLNRKTMELYASYFDFNGEEGSCTFDENLEKQTKEEMLLLISQIKKRLAELNDEGFEVEDYVTERLIAL